jgi:hypothetical protein
MKLLVKKYAMAFYPFGDEAIESFEKIKQGECFEVEIKKTRSPQQHRLLFSLLKLAVDHNEGLTTDTILGFVKIKTGHATPVYSEGVSYLIPKSIAFCNFEQHEFQEFFNKACEVVAEHFFDGMNTQDLIDEVMLRGGGIIRKGEA